MVSHLTATSLSNSSLILTTDRISKNKPFLHTLLSLGSEIPEEPWGRFYSDNTWHYDAECIEDDGIYKEIVLHLARISGQTKKITDVEDSLFNENGNDWLTYTINGKTRKIDFIIKDDWIDGEVLNYVLYDLSSDDYKFYCILDGQCGSLFYLNQEQAKELTRLSYGLLEEYRTTTPVE